jgi:enterochelin esterase family protein
MISDTRPVSPRLLALSQELAVDKPVTLTAFWSDILAQGTPLVEPLPDQPTNLLVTFLWRASDPATQVAVIGDLTQRSAELLAQLPNTDIWYKSYRLPANLRTTYELVVNDNWQLDPYNPQQFHVPRDETTNTGGYALSILELPAAPPQPWLVSQADIPTGNVSWSLLHSAILNNERRVWVYTPPHYSSVGSAYGWMLLLDGWAYTQFVPTPILLDNLIAAKQLPPIVVIFLDTLDTETTRLRELSCSGFFRDFVCNELVPWVHQHYHVSADPRCAVVAGSSHGGLAAAYLGLQLPMVFGNVLSQSGSFPWRPDEAIEDEWLSRQYALSERVALRFYLDVGLLETWPSPTGGPSWLLANRHMRTVLQAKGYEVTYAEYSGGHDYVCWRGTLVDGLRALVREQCAHADQSGERIVAYTGAAVS